MGKEDYELLANKMEEIANHVKRFPDDLQGRVFDELIFALMGKKSVASQNGSESSQYLDEILNLPEVLPEPEKEKQISNGNYATAFVEFASLKDSDNKLAEIRFAAVVAYFFKYNAPVDKQQNLTEDLLNAASRLAKRKPPKNPAQVMRDSASKLRFLSNVNTGEYEITPIGEHYVENELPSNGK